MHPILSAPGGDYLYRLARISVDSAKNDNPGAELAARYTAKGYIKCLADCRKIDNFTDLYLMFMDLVEEGTKNDL